MIIAYSREKQYKDVGKSRQLFVDDDVVACVRNVKRTQHTPKKHPANPLIKRDKPWEVVPYFRTSTFNVTKDTSTGLFKCWYEDYYDYFGTSKVSLFQGNRLYYARSQDGLNWEKPGLGKLSIDGNDTNTVFSYLPGEMCSCCSVLFDPHDQNPSRRFKMLYFRRVPGANMPKHSPRGDRNTAGLCLAYSPNGIDWTPYEGNPLFPRWGGDVEILTFDPIDRKYVLFGRAQNRWISANPKFNAWFAPVWPDRPTGVWGTRRCVYRLESEDCLHWSEPELVFDPGQDDNLQDAHYGFVPWRVDEMHLGILNIFHEVDNTLDMELLYGRNGRNWQRFPNRQPLIPRGEEGSYDYLDVETPNQPLIVGDEVWIYYGGMSVHHDWWLFGREEGLDVPEARDPSYAQNGHHLCLATIRLDGWVSLDATVREGYVETKPVFSAGAHLFINGRCAPNGYIQVEVMDNWDNVWQGYSREDCQAFRGDSVHHRVCWSAGDAVNMVPGIVKLRFHLRNAELYSFQFADD